MIHIKTTEEIALMREGGRILARTLRVLSDKCESGVRVEDLDVLAERTIREAGATPSFKGYQGYPSSVCVSLNDEVVHGLPRDHVLVEGDIVSLDVGVFYKGFHTDSAITLGVGALSKDAQKLLSVTKASLELGIALVKPGITTGDLGHEIHALISSQGLGVVRELVGHGVGRDLQEDPMVPNFGRKGKGIELKEGMTIAIEPMVTLGEEDVMLDEDGFTYKTADGSLAAHFEHTIAITSMGAEVLTKI